MSIFGLKRINNESDIDYNRRIKREDDIWNAAIEAAVKVVDDEGDYNPSSYYIDAIRKLKK